MVFLLLVQSCPDLEERTSNPHHNSGLLESSSVLVDSVSKYFPCGTQQPKTNTRMMIL